MKNFCLFTRREFSTEVLGLKKFVNGQFIWMKCLAEGNARKNFTDLSVVV